MSALHLHPIYQEVFDDHCANLATTSSHDFLNFYRRLPSPRKITNTWVRQLLKGKAINTQIKYVSFLVPIEKKLNKPLLAGIKSPRRKREQRELYSREELQHMLKACTDTRDRAMISVLYETGARASEFLDMKFEHLEKSSSMWKVAIMGKGSRPRKLFLYDSIPYLTDWLNVHPTGKGALWTTLSHPPRPLTYGGLNQRIETIQSRAKITKRRGALHLFRHTRLTNLAQLGLTEFQLGEHAGWVPGSHEARTYIQESGVNIEHALSKVYGIETQEQEQPKEKVLAVRVCGRCHYENPALNTFCGRCSTPLDTETVILAQTTESEMREEINKLRNVIHDLTLVVNQLRPQ